MKRVFIISFVLVLVSCSKKELILKDLMTKTIYVDKQKIVSRENDFSIEIPKNWNCEVNKDFINEDLILDVSALSEIEEEHYFSSINIGKRKGLSGQDDLKTEYEYIMDYNKDKISENVKSVESGEIIISNNLAYFIHTKLNTGTYGEDETIFVILKSKTNGVFYYINLSTSQTKNLERNMIILVESLKTFKIF